MKILTTQDGEPAVCEHPPTQTRPAAEVDWGDFLYQNFSIVFCFVSLNWGDLLLLIEVIFLFVGQGGYIVCV